MGVYRHRPWERGDGYLAGLAKWPRSCGGLSPAGFDFFANPAGVYPYSALLIGSDMTRWNE